MGEHRDPERAKQALRLVLAGAGLLSVISYVHSPAAADSPIESARYLSLLAISLPAALWPLWRVVRSGRAMAIPAAVPIGALAATMLVATVSVVPEVSRYAELRNNQRRLLAALDEANLGYVHSEYWTCNWITYLSGERIACGVVDDSLNRGFNRYPGYWREQAQAQVAPVGSTLDAELARHMSSVTPQVVAGYHIYLGSPLP